MMAEKPILFSTLMVQALLDGRKTQTRRSNGLNEINKAPDDWQLLGYCRNPEGDNGKVLQGDFAVFGRKTDRPNDPCVHVKCPYPVGTRLWVRETWYKNYPHEYGRYFYRADGEEIDMPTIYGKTVKYGKSDGLKWRPSIHMPKEAARIWLEVTDVRVERLQEITEEDAIKEGFEPVPCFCSERGAYGCTDCMNTGRLEPALLPFHDTWDDLNAKRGYGWDTNPWVRVITFKRVEG